MVPISVKFLVQAVNSYRLCWCAAESMCALPADFSFDVGRVAVVVLRPVGGPPVWLPVSIDLGSFVLVGGWVGGGRPPPCSGLTVHTELGPDLT